MCSLRIYILVNRVITLTTLVIICDKKKKIKQLSLDFKLSEIANR